MGAVLHGDKVAVHERLFIGGILSESDQLFIICEHGIIALQLFLNIDPLIIGVFEKPGISGRKSGVFLSAPLHRRARVIPTEESQGLQRFLPGDACLYGHLICVDGGDVVQLLYRADLLVLHADLLALIDEGQSAAEEIHGGKRFFARFRAHFGRQIAAGASGLVVILDDRGIKSYITDLLVGAEHAASVSVDIDALCIKPALVAAAVELG